MYRLAILAALLSPSCAMVQTHTIQSTALLGPNGRVTANVTWTAPPALHLRLDNLGPGRVTYTATDLQGRVLDTGTIAREAKSLSWKRADGRINLALEADATGARVDYRFSSQDGVSVELDVTNAKSR